MRTVAIIQARMGSTRFPGKVLALLWGEPMLKRMIDRVVYSETLDDICVATTDAPEDDAIQDLCRKLSVPCFRGDGDPNDVLYRVVCAASQMGAELIVELTGDCPLVDPRIIDQTVAAYHRAPTADFASTTLDAAPRSASCYPRGMDVRVFSARALRYVLQATGGPPPLPLADFNRRDIYREHVSLYMWEHSTTSTNDRRDDRFVTRHVGPWPPRYTDYRLTVDEPLDLRVVDAVYGSCQRKSGRPFGINKILDYLDENYEVAYLNRAISQKIA